MTNERIVNVFVDGVRVNFPDPDQRPRIVGNSTMMPLRKIFEEVLGFDVEWDDRNFSPPVIFIRKGERGSAEELIMMLTIDKYEFRRIIGDAVRVDDFELYVAPHTINDRTMIPLRRPLEAAGYGVRWDGATDTANIRTIHRAYHECITS